MNSDDIIRMAREAYGDWYPNAVPNELERFAALVAAAEHEACEKIASDYADYQRSFGDEYAELRAMGALEVMDRIRTRRFRAFVRCFVGALEALAEDRLDEGERCPCTRCDYSCEDRRKGER